MTDTAKDVRRKHYASFSPDKSQLDDVMKRLCDQLSSVVSTFNSFVDVANVNTDAQKEYVAKALIIAQELSDIGFEIPKYGVSVNGPIGYYDARNQGAGCALIQKSGFAATAVLMQSQAAMELFVGTGVTQSACSIPDNATVKGIAAKVTGAPTGASSFVLKSSTGTALSTTITTALNTKAIGRTNCPYTAGAGESLNIEFDTAPTLGDGKIELVMFYEAISQS